ncbi:hypothetical protein [Actinoallomurus acaciae]|uniref:Uncharacterized protein n=1 Tax=Actinoallomurus acaciae TaxID=502577 RepID=A0ABV5YLN1_9ACTN
MFASEDPADVIEEQAERLRKIGTAAREVDIVTMPAKAAKVFEQKHRPAVESLIDGNEVLGQMCERALPYMIRVAALYALADGRDAIKVRDFDAALALVRYSVETVVAVLPTAGEDPLVTKIADAVRNAAR